MPKEAADFENLVRRSLRAAFRGLKDVYLSPGHMSEDAHYFEAAIRYHQKAYSAFNQCGFPKREIWQDGRQHAPGHVSMNLYDKGIRLEGQGRISEACDYIKTAYFFAQDCRIAIGMPGRACLKTLCVLMRTCLSSCA